MITVLSIAAGVLLLAIFLAPFRISSEQSRIEEAWERRRPHVKWIHETDALWKGGGLTRCPCCGWGYADGAYHEVEEWDFCPHCGECMREEAPNV